MLKYKAIMEKHYPTLSYGVRDDDKTIMWLDKTVPKPDFDALWNAMKQYTFLEQIRKDRDALLAETDKYVMADYAHSKKDAYITYRQALRDLPAKYKALMTGVYDYKDRVLTKSGVETNLFPVIV